MRTVIRFKRFVRAEVVPADGVYLISERSGQTRLQGALIERMAPLLSGKHDRSQIVAALAGDFPGGRVERALDMLMSAGHVVEVDSAVEPRSGGYWEQAGLDGDAAMLAVHDRPVELITLGDVRPEWFVDAAAPLGIRFGGADSPLGVVLTDDYLHPDLAEFNRVALETGRAWLLVKPIGSTLWVGPVFEPGTTGCWSCVSSRLSGNRMVASYLKQRQGGDRPPVTALADLPATVQTGMRLGALQAAKWLAGAFGGPAGHIPGPQQAEVFTLDTLTMDSERHPVTRRPQCPACGNPALQAELHRRPVVPASRGKRITSDGGHRAKDPQELLDTYGYLVSPVTGPVTSLVKVPTGIDGLHSYTAGQNFAVGMSDIGDLRAGLRSMSAGKGMSDVQARASALGEAIERYSGLFQGDEARITASYEDLGEQAIAPNELHLYSEQQYADRAEWNRRDSHFHRVCDPFDPARPVEWTPVWSLTRRTHRYLPTASLFYGYRVPRGYVFSGADSNGSAAGTSLEDAALQGFMELVERDSVAIWWYNRLRRPAIDLDSFDEPYFAQWREMYRSANRETWVLDLTSDLGIPVAAAVSRRVDKPVEDILISFGAHFDIKVAVARALTEMNQFLPAVLPIGADGSGDYAFPDPVQQHWWRTATTANQPYLLPSGEAPRWAGDHHDPSSSDLLDDLRLAQRIVEGKGLEMLILDQTRPDIGLPVVKVIVPGLRHFWPRYGAGRLYDVPVRMGWLDAPTPESGLNPIGMFL
ncbi:TOMM precursor leader peptide-binding protein [Streptomyces sp. NPDC088253]|uniref:TOMM precursor leader peptide-binding protein n=1 Tax=Streptomyces sp. NPDC088253 TaxID=3365846 RepID=UPI00382737C5